MSIIGTLIHEFGNSRLSFSLIPSTELTEKKNRKMFPGDKVEILKHSEHEPLQSWGDPSLSPSLAWHADSPLPLTD